MDTVCISDNITAYALTPAEKALRAALTVIFGVCFILTGLCK